MVVEVEDAEQWREELVTTNRQTLHKHYRYSQYICRWSQDKEYRIASIKRQGFSEFLVFWWRRLFEGDALFKKIITFVNDNEKSINNKINMS